jgi:hypothetical protein
VPGSRRAPGTRPEAVAARVRCRTAKARHGRRFSAALAARSCVGRSDALHNQALRVRRVAHGCTFAHEYASGRPLARTIALFPPRAHKRTIALASPKRSRAAAPSQKQSDRQRDARFPQTDTVVGGDETPVEAREQVGAPRPFHTNDLAGAVRRPSAETPHPDRAPRGRRSQERRLERSIAECKVHWCAFSKHAQA